MRACNTKQRQHVKCCFGMNTVPWVKLEANRSSNSLSIWVMISTVINSYEVNKKTANTIHWEVYVVTLVAVGTCTRIFHFNNSKSDQTLRLSLFWQTLLMFNFCLVVLHVVQYKSLKAVVTSQGSSNCHCCFTARAQLYTIIPTKYTFLNRSVSGESAGINCPHTF